MKFTEVKPIELSALTGLRIFAAFAILFHHLSITILKFDRGFQLLLKHWMTVAGHFGMTLFFVLSGFIIHYNYFNKIRTLSFISIYNFLVARFARLYPLFLFFLILGYVVNVANIHSVMEALPRFLTLTQVWSYHLIGTHSATYFLNCSNNAWSISTEFFLYLTYPLTAILLSGLYKNKFRSGPLFSFNPIFLLSTTIVFRLLENLQA